MRPATAPSATRRALAVSLLLLAALASVMYYTGEVTAEKPELLVRGTALALPPPPPPPTPVSMQHADRIPTLDLAVASEASPVAIAPVDPSAVLDHVAVRDPAPPQPDMAWERDLSVDWQALSVDALDAPPRVVALYRAPWPSDLARRNIARAVVKLDVFIDEQGVPSLVEIVDNPYPVLDAAIRDIVRGSRFSPPTSKGEAARARFIWPLEIRQ
ncbi:energy transducer TonB [Parahaliea mediterranea]|uniref:TonB C-terminal domain-containing protein n=1 Tax=Parahaliea mediterranea TaxID=651086 RepID=A0A939DFK8_9GAMM|nr:energy transducer TonB [Parahaliea mediterranea]MBN7797203.1 hypothetical protein [Parahaliea mediterranea]